MWYYHLIKARRHNPGPKLFIAFDISVTILFYCRVWDVGNQKCLKMLPHPTFVYCAKFHPRVSKIIVTGSYDNIVRVWQIEGSDIQGNYINIMLLLNFIKYLKTSEIYE